MTPEQVSALSDNELNRAMIWLFCNEFKEGYPELEFIEDSGSVVSMDLGEYTWEPNYIEDYNLTMPLALDAALDIELMTITRVSEGYDGKVARNKNPLRAICECLVLIALGERDG